MHSLLAVYRDRHDAEAAADDLARATDGPATLVHIGERHDLELSIRAEMDEETAESIGSPGLGAFMTKEMMRGAAVFALALGGVGLVVGALIGLALAGASGWAWWERGLLGAVVGAGFLGTVGTLIGGGMAMRSPEDQLAAERGVTLRFDRVTPDAERILIEHHPIRLDHLADGQRVATPATEGPSGMAEMVDDFVRTAADPRRQG